MPDSPDLDLTLFYEIADGSDEFIVESIGIFLNQSPGILQELADAIDAGNWETAAISAHKIKANLGFFGMNNSYALITEIEAESKTGGEHPAKIKEKFNQAVGYINGAFATLQEIKAEKEANI